MKNYASMQWGAHNLFLVTYFDAHTYMLPYNTPVLQATNTMWMKVGWRRACKTNCIHSAQIKLCSLCYNNRFTYKQISLQKLHSSYMHVTFLWTPHQVLISQSAIHCVWLEFTLPIVKCICWECKVWLAIFAFNAEEG